MKSSKLFMIMLVVVGLCLTGIQFSDAATKACTNCCKDCAMIYSDQVGDTPTPPDFRAAVPTSKPGLQPSNLTCYWEALWYFGGCCWATNCGAPQNELFFYMCVGGALGIHGACEEGTREQQEECQGECRDIHDCSGCGGC